VLRRGPAAGRADEVAAKSNRMGSSAQKGHNGIRYVSFDSDTSKIDSTQETKRLGFVNGKKGDRGKSGTHRSIGG
jgi:hypothetical protein